ncbi:MAG: hypothetical protein ACYDEA_09400, partial [Candidatus Dormibacteria bacterium]
GFDGKRILCRGRPQRGGEPAAGTSEACGFSFGHCEVDSDDHRVIVYLFNRGWGQDRDLMEFRPTAATVTLTRRQLGLIGPKSEALLRLPIQLPPVDAEMRVRARCPWCDARVMIDAVHLADLADVIAGYRQGAEETTFHVDPKTVDRFVEGCRGIRPPAWLERRW